MLSRNKKPVYYCRRRPTDEDDVERFYPPEKIFLNYRAVSGGLLLESGGEINSRNLIAKITGDAGNYSENDRAYVHVIPPGEHDELCSDADYVLKSVLESRNVTELIFERLA